MVKKSNNKNPKKAIKTKTQKPQKKSTALTSVNRSQRMRSSVPIASSQSRAAYFNVGPGSKPGSCRVRGQDMLSSITLGATGYLAGQNLANIYINPYYFSGTRLERFGQMYDKYLFRNLKFHLVSASPTTTPGSLLMAYDRDWADNTPTADDVGLRQYFAMMNTKSASTWESFSIDCPLSDLQDFYYTNNTGVGDGRLVYQGQLYVSCASAFNIITATSSLLWVEYDIELFDPQLQTEVSSLSDVTTTSITTDNTPNKGWDQFLISNALKVTGAAKMFQGANPGSPTDVGITLPGGTYLVEQILNGLTGSSSNWNAPTAVARSVLENIVQQNIYSYGGSTGGSSGRVDKIKIPPAGGILNGNYGSSGITATKGSVYITPTSSDSYGVIL